MAGLDLLPFADEHIDEAARLLERRHRRHRAAEPSLPDLLDLRAEIAALRARGASGAVGLRDGRVAGYLLGTRLSDEVWGPNVWVELAGHAADEPEDVRDLYGLAAARWVGDGRSRHYVYVPASDAGLVEAWFRLGFGQQHAFGIRELPAGPAPGVRGVVIREAEARDLDALLALAPLLGAHQALSPVFSRGPQPDDEDELRAEIAEEISSSSMGSLVAEIGGRLVASFVVVPVERSSAHSGLARPERSALLAWAATLPEARGAGAGLALTAACLAWARERGYETIVTDWRVTNLLSSRFWPRRGWRTTFLRVYRSIP